MKERSSRLMIFGTGSLERPPRLTLYVHRIIRLIRDGEPRTDTSTFTQLLSSVKIVGQWTRIHFACTDYLLVCNFGGQLVLQTVRINDVTDWVKMAALASLFSATFTNIDFQLTREWIDGRRKTKCLERILSLIPIGEKSVPCVWFGPP